MEKCFPAIFELFDWTHAKITFYKIFENFTFSWIGWGQILECIYFTHFPRDWMLRSFKCIEISLSDQTPGAETLSKVCVWTNESSAGSVLYSHWSRHKIYRGSPHLGFALTEKFQYILSFLASNLYENVWFYTFQKLPPT